MTGEAAQSRAVSVADGLRSVALAGGDARVRATWRVLLPWPLLWFAAGSAGVAVATAIVPASVSGPTTMAAFGLSQAAFFTVAWVAWARYLDRRPLSRYGFSVSRPWLFDLVVAFGAVLAGHGVWYGIGAALGVTSVELSPASPETSLPFGLAAVLVAISVNVWVQATVFYGVTLQNAAEGLSSRGITAPRAVLGAWLAAVAIFTLKHRPPTAGRTLNLVVALGIFGLLYVHTGELALPIGVHAGVNYAGSALVASPAAAGDRLSVLVVSESLPGLPGSLADGAIPQILVAYLLLLGWIWWRRGGVGIRPGLARWQNR